MLLTRRQKRLLPLLLLLSLPVLLLIIRLAWGLYADHHLTQTRASLKSQGFRVYPEDFSPKSITTESKAAALILHAAKSLTLTPEQTAVIEGKNHNGRLSAIPWAPFEYTHIRQAIAANPTVFDDLDQAAREPRGNFPKPFSGPFDDKFKSIHQLSNFLFLAGLAAHDQKNDQQTLEHFHRLLILSKNLSAQADIQTALVCTAKDSLAAEGIVHLHNTLDLQSSPHTAALARLLISDLLDDEYRDAQLVAAFGWDTIDLPSLNAKRSPPWQAWPILPAFTLQSARYTLRRFEFAKAIPTKNWSTIDAIDKRRHGDDDDHMEYVTQRNYWYSNALVIQLAYRSTVDRHAAAALLAAALYRADHQSQNPDSLATLIPTYLPSMPMDLFTPTPQPLHYRATPQLLVWSVGENAVDDDPCTEPQKTMESPDLWQEKDAVYGPSRITAPSFPL